MPAPNFPPPHALSRAEAGGLLAGRLLSYTDRPHAWVFGIPRGGVPVAAAVARRLLLPLEILPVRRIRVPGYADVTLGAVADPCVAVLDQGLVSRHRLPSAVIEGLIAQQREEIQRWQTLCHCAHALPDKIRGGIALLVDDAILTGATARAASQALRQAGARVIVIATPVMSRAAFVSVRHDADELIALQILSAVPRLADFYADAHAVTEDEVVTLVERAETAAGRQGAPRGWPAAVPQPLS